MLGIEGDADARADLEPGTLDRERLADLVEQLDGDRLCVPGTQHLAREHRELVAAKAHESAIARRQPGREPRADRPQQLIPRIVAEGVVDFLEVVEIYQHQRDVPAFARRDLDFVRELPRQPFAVRQTGERIVQRLVLERVEREAAIGDVAPHAPDSYQRALLDHADHRDREPDRQAVLGLGGDLQVAQAEPGVDQRCGHDARALFAGQLGEMDADHARGLGIAEQVGHDGIAFREHRLYLDAFDQLRALERDRDGRIEIGTPDRLGAVLDEGAIALLARAQLLLDAATMVGPEQTRHEVCDGGGEILLVQCPDALRPDVFVADDADLDASAPDRGIEHRCDSERSQVTRSQFGGAGIGERIAHRNCPVGMKGLEVLRIVGSVEVSVVRVGGALAIEQLRAVHDSTRLVVEPDADARNLQRVCGAGADPGECLFERRIAQPVVGDEFEQGHLLSAHASLGHDRGRDRLDRAGEVDRTGREFPDPFAAAVEPARLTIASGHTELDRGDRALEQCRLERMHEALPVHGIEQGHEAVARARKLAGDEAEEALQLRRDPERAGFGFPLPDTNPPGDQSRVQQAGGVAIVRINQGRVPGRRRARVR